MTTEPTPEAPGYVAHEAPCEDCKRRNETDQLTRLEGQLERIGNLLEDIRDARRGQTTQRPPTPEEVRAFARGGIVKRPDDQTLIGRTGCAIPGYCPTHDGRVIAIRGGRPTDVTEEAIQARMPEPD